MNRDVFQAIADPTRREIIHLLASGPLPVNDVAEKFQISRPAVSKHLKVLNESGLVVIRQNGRQRYCYAELKELKKVSDWANRYHSFWSDKLDTLERVLRREDEQKQ